MRLVAIMEKLDQFKDAENDQAKPEVDERAQVYLESLMPGSEG